MAIGKYISLEEALKENKLDRFIKEHPSEGDEKAFLGLVSAMVKTPESDDQTSGSKRHDED